MRARADRAAPSARGGRRGPPGACAARARLLPPLALLVLVIALGGPFGGTSGGSGGGSSGVVVAAAAAAAANGDVDGTATREGASPAPSGGRGGRNKRAAGLGRGMPAPTEPLSATPANLTACPRLRIALINGVPFHYEVLAGLLHVLSPYGHVTDVYLNRYARASNADGAWDLLRWSNASFKLITNKLPAKPMPTYGLVILVSTDYELETAAEVLRHMRPTATVALVHNAGFGGLPRLLNATSTSLWSPGASPGGGAAPGDVRLLTLAPHVAAALSAVTRAPVVWALPSYPFQPKEDCLDAPATQLLGSCLKGFSMQGKFSNKRRNYTAIWAQLEARGADLRAPAVAPLFHLSLLGKGPNRLNLPAALEPRVSLLRRLHYARFYEAIHHTFALLPALAGDRYYTDKFSSTIISSLTAGTPMIVNERFIEAYQAFSPADVYLQRAGEAEVDVMLRVLAMPAPELLAVRRALRETRRRLNDAAAEYYAALLREVCSKEQQQQ